MRLVWKDIFCIMELMFRLNQKGIADCLGVSEFTISRLKTGAVVEFSRFNKKYQGKGSVEEIYDLMFDPNNKNSPARSKSDAYDRTPLARENHLLLTFKEAIHDARLKDSLGELWGSLCKSSYKDTVIYVLKRVRNPSKATIPQATDFSDNPADYYIGDEAVWLREVFKDAVLDHRIDVLLDRRSGDLSGQQDQNTYDDLLAEADAYFKEINEVLRDSSIRRRFDDNEKRMLKDIAAFNSILRDYVGILHMRCFFAYRSFDHLNANYFYEQIITILERIWSYRNTAESDDE